MLRIADIFDTIQGEGFHAGRPAVFVRLQGCNLRCPWCDEPSALQFNATRPVTEQDIAERVLPDLKRTKYLVLTGGEPTAQDCSVLLELLFKAVPELTVSVETNGTLPWKDWLDYCWITLSPKTKPGGKAPTAKMLHRAAEVKLVVEQDTDLEKEYQYWRHACEFRDGVAASPWLYLMPEDGQQKEVLPKIIEFVKQHPEEARVCLRQHKLMGVK